MYGTPPYYDILRIEINNKIMYNLFILYSLPVLLLNSKAQPVNVVTTEFELLRGFYNFFISEIFKT